MFAPRLLWHFSFKKKMFPVLSHAAVVAKDFFLLDAAWVRSERPSVSYWCSC